MRDGSGSFLSSRETESSSNSEGSLKEKTRKTLPKPSGSPQTSFVSGGSRSNSSSTVTSRNSTAKSKRNGSNGAGSLDGKFDSKRSTKTTKETTVLGFGGLHEDRDSSESSDELDGSLKSEDSKYSTDSSENSILQTFFGPPKDTEDSSESSDELYGSLQSKDSKYSTDSSEKSIPQTFIGPFKDTEDNLNISKLMESVTDPPLSKAEMFESTGVKGNKLSVIPEYKTISESSRGSITESTELPASMGKMESHAANPLMVTNNTTLESTSITTHSAPDVIGDQYLNATSEVAQQTSNDRSPVSTEVKSIQTSINSILNDDNDLQSVSTEISEENIIVLDSPSNYSSSSSSPSK